MGRIVSMKVSGCMVGLALMDEPVGNGGKGCVTACCYDLTSRTSLRD